MVAKPSWYYDSPDDDNSFSNKPIEEGSLESDEREKKKSVFIADANGQVIEEVVLDDEEGTIFRNVVISNPRLGSQKGTKFRTRHRNYKSPGKKTYHDNLTMGINYFVYKKLEKEGVETPAIINSFLTSRFIAIMLTYLKKQWVMWSLSHRKRVARWKVSQRKLNSILDRFPTEFLAIVLAPFCAYGVVFVAKSSDEIRGQFLNSVFPGSTRFITRPEKVSLATCKSISYLKKLNWETLKRLNYYPGSTYMVFGPDSRLATDKFFGAAVKVEGINLNPEKTFFVLNREYNLCFPSKRLLPLIRKFNDKMSTSFKPDYTNFQLATLQYFQQNYIRLDLIPTNLGHTFAIHKKPKLAPLFKRVSKPKVRTRYKKSILQRLRRGKKREFYDPSITHIDLLRHNLIQSDAFAQQNYADFRRVLQYKTANCLGVFREVVGMFVHRGTVIEIADEVFEIDFYFNDDLDVQGKLASFVTYNHPKPSEIRTRDEAANYRLLKALSEDMREFYKDRKTPNIKEKMIKKNLVSRFKYKIPVEPNNPFGRLGTTDRQRESSSDLTTLTNKQFNVLPRFQDAFLKYAKRELAKDGLISRPFYLAFDLNPALKTPPQIKGLRIRRYPKYSKKTTKS